MIIRKLLTIVTFAVFLSFAGSALTVTAENSVSVKQRVLFENPNTLVITQPDENGRVTTAANTSLLGMRDRNFPLYINGVEVPTTENGFFTAYAELEFGENIFLFQNGDYLEEIIVVREPPEDYIPPVTLYYQVPVYASTEYNNISRFYDFDDDTRAGTPLVSGTTFKIIAERDHIYLLEDESCVFKKDVYMLDREIPPITLSDGVVTGEFNEVFVRFSVTDNPLYSVELDGNNARLSIYADEFPELEPDGFYITEVATKTDLQPSDPALIYNLTFQKPPIGYAVSFDDGTMTVKFRFAAADLEAARVLLDAGHGGTDPGALGPPADLGPMEKDFNLYVASIARDYLESLGVNVTFVREHDEYINIMDRIDYFTSDDYDVAVCVHTNSMPLSSDFSKGVGTLMFYTLDLSEEAAEEIIALIAEETNNDYVPAIRRNFAMARYTTAPSMLFEMGFMCNPADYERLLGIDYLDNMGLALGRAIEQRLTTAAETGALDFGLLETDENLAEFAPGGSPVAAPAMLVMGGQGGNNAQYKIPPPSVYNNHNGGVLHFITIITIALLGGGVLVFVNRSSLTKQ